MFKRGDIVKIQKNWLDKGEDPDVEYFVLDDYGDGKVKVCLYNQYGGYKGVWDYGYEMVYLAGHVGWNKHLYKEGDLLADETDQYYLVVDEVDPKYNKYHLVGIKPDNIKNKFFDMHITDLYKQGYRFVKSLTDGEK